MRLGRWRPDGRTLALVVAAVVAVVLAMAAFQHSGSDLPESSDLQRPTPSTTMTPTAVPTSESQTRPSDDFVQVAVIGDSSTASGAFGGVGEANWVEVLTDELRDSGTAIRTSVRAAGQSGYVARGAAGRAFGDLIPTLVRPETQIVIMIGGANDAAASADVGPAADAAYRAVMQIAPDAVLLVVGPVRPGSQAPQPILDVRDELRQAAERAGVVFVDPIAEGWFADPSAGFVAPDGSSPTDAGHTQIALALLPYIEELV